MLVRMAISGRAATGAMYQGMIGLPSGAMHASSVLPDGAPLKPVRGSAKFAELAGMRLTTAVQAAAAARQASTT